MSLTVNFEDIESEDEYFEIPSIGRNRAGLYECTATNDIDIDRKRVKLVVNCKCVLCSLSFTPNQVSKCRAK